MTRTLLLVDSQREAEMLPGREAVTFDAYLQGEGDLRNPGLRVINLCDTQHYLSRGYYCSLLAEARRQKVIPEVAVINDLREAGRGSGLTLAEQLPTELPVADAHGESPSHIVYFGWTADPAWQPLGREIFRRFPAPVLQVSLRSGRTGPRVLISRLAFSRLDEEQRSRCLDQLDRFTQSSWKPQRPQRGARWDMAILVNPDEPHPPSNKRALRRFVRAAARHGIKAELVTAQTLGQLPFYDALFIRETTAIDHHTYRLARRAEELGLVVIDDPRSILRCCNKVYLHDAFDSEGVPTLRTQAVSSHSAAVLDQLEQAFGYPMVLKLPEGSFSLGVFRVETRKELAARLGELLKSTALVLVQEYLYTPFDWRIGVLDRRAIFACRYDMVRNHWQIYDHSRKRGSAGDSITLPTFEVPRQVLEAAVRACKVAGDGFYGVDLKQSDERIAVIEVNDNPSIDAGVEDEYLGKELYDQVMAVFAARLEQRGR